MIHYLFGYGSLINHQNRALTGRTKDPIPVRVLGLERAWNVVAYDSQMTGLGVVMRESAVCNGVLVAVEDEELEAFDKREMEGTGFNYERVEINKENILGATAITDGLKIWTYVVKRPTAPTIDFPILQSYVDIVLTGCLEFGEDFAVEFVHSTTGWASPWYDDRARPRYIRHLKMVDCRKIDEILARHVPEGLALRKRIC